MLVKYVFVICASSKDLARFGICQFFIVMLLQSERLDLYREHAMSLIQVISGYFMH